MNPHTPGDTFDPRSVHWCLDRGGLRQAAELIAGAHEVVLDLETTDLDPWAARPVPPRIVLAALTLPQSGMDTPPTVVVPLSHPDGPWPQHWRRVARSLASSLRGRPLIGHNIKFDLRWLHASTDVDLHQQVVWDTQVSAHLLDETTSTALKERAPRTFGIERWDDHDLSTPGAAERVPMFDLGVYGARDTYWTWRLAVAHRALMGAPWAPDCEPPLPPETPEDREALLLGRLARWCAMPTVRTLTAIEQCGMVVDHEWLDRAEAECDGICAAMWRRLLAQAEVLHLQIDAEPSLAPTSRWWLAFADAAVEAGDLEVTATTATGRPRWDRTVLRRQARRGATVAADVLAWRDADKRRQFLRAWRDASAATGMAHPTYHAGRVVSGRLSSSDPNAQQVTAALKPMVVSRPGRVIVEADLSQIEVRIAAWIADCAPLIEVYRTGRDVYREQAAEVTGRPVEEITADDRQRAKAVVLGYLYGQSPAGFLRYAEAVWGMTVTPEEAEESHAAFFRRWVGMREWHGRAIAEARRTGQIVSPFGRVRRLPTIRHPDPKTAARALNAAINSPVQATASDLMQMAAASIAGTLPGHDPVADCRLIGTVHDSVVAEVPADGWQTPTGQMITRIVDIPTVLHRVFGVDLPVPLVVEAKIGSRWGLDDIATVRSDRGIVYHT